ncbi:TPA: hypothetical protein RTH03_001276 [Campylobacter jejuni]|nr:hypothetical protein [Campylobacter jejuni]HDZ5084105.1 hypothetical protein [Campylobacter jejuni]HDZ5085961.1 hypothetical protein [Campylobacter jejuni]HDZ5087408.1 hypothetical protein [Campylobacter jejuni]HDZ5090870.1 hypothetical protein [Campylobacter jejuni]
MKKSILLASALLTSSILLADSLKIEGTIAQIYDNNKTLLIDSIYGEQIAIKVLPNTEIEMDDCGIFGTDKEGTFKDLRVGNFLESKIFYGTPATSNAQAIPVARKIEIQCYKKAY